MKDPIGSRYNIPEKSAKAERVTEPFFTKGAQNG